jgi:uncharacterized membrane-anchored protein YhcB (DUF1043 family)
MKPVWIRHLQLKPHGDHLLTPSGAFWLLSARTLVFLMAWTEAFAWSYLGFSFGDGPLGWIAVAFVGPIVFLLVWIIDVSMVTFDRAWPEHAHAVLGERPPKTRILREIASFGLRIALVVGSMTVTAPYLSQLVFHRDVDHAIAIEAATRLAAARRDTVEQSGIEFERRRTELNVKRSEYEREVAGQGASRKYGMGPAATALAASVSSLERDIANLTESQNERLNTFDVLQKDWKTNREQLGSLYGVELPQNSIMENRRVLDSLLALPENQSVGLAIKMFLGFLFSGLVLLKLFEPSSIRLYLSEVLQQEYQRYLAVPGEATVQAWPVEANAPAAMTPQRFYEFVKALAAPEKQARQREETERAGATLRAGWDALDQMRQQAVHHFSQQAMIVRRLTADVDEASRSSVELGTAMEGILRDLEFFQAELESVDSAENPMDRSRFDYRNSLLARHKEASAALRTLKEKEPGERERRRRLESELSRAGAALDESRRELATRERLTRRIRSMIANGAEKQVRAMVIHAPGTVSDLSHLSSRRTRDETKSDCESA